MERTTASMVSDSLRAGMMTETSGPSTGAMSLRLGRRSASRTSAANGASHGSAGSSSVTDMRPAGRLARGLLGPAQLLLDGVQLALDFDGIVVGDEDGDAVLGEERRDQRI